MNAKHTPGPWHIEGTVRQGNAAGFIIAHGINSHRDGPEGYILTANHMKREDADLICASPDLLAASERHLKAVVALGETPPGRKDTYFEAPLLETDEGVSRWMELNDAGVVLKAAIARATGAA